MSNLLRPALALLLAAPLLASPALAQLAPDPGAPTQPAPGATAPPQPAPGVPQIIRPEAARPDPAFLTADQVTTILRARGYSEIAEVVQEGDSFRIPEAVRYGQKVQNLRIDALTGQPREQPLLTEAQATALLRDRGYVEVTELGRDGDLIRLRAVRDGTPTELRVDARSGAVRQ